MESTRIQAIKCRPSVRSQTYPKRTCARSAASSALTLASSEFVPPLAVSPETPACVDASRAHIALASTGASSDLGSRRSTCCDTEV